MANNIQKRIFTFNDQNTFANLSGDYNPLHTDPVIARRLIYGGMVVHGIHELLWVLDNWLEETSEPIYLRTIKAEFRKPIRVEEEVTYSVKSQRKNHVEIELLTGGTPALWLEMDFVLSQKNEIEATINKSPGRNICKEYSPDEVASASGSMDLCLESDLLKKIFPNISKAMSLMQVAELLATTRLVGMECPGMNSVYSGMHLEFADEGKASRELKWKVESLDKRFRSLSMHVETSGMKGTLKAFFRPVSQKQLSINLISQFIQADEFAGQKSLIIGGSRGLGEVTAKLLAAGGAEVKITYYKGEGDARRVVDEIISYGGNADYAGFDVLNPPEDFSDKFGKQWLPTHLYYFATPFIFEANRGIFSPELFEKFIGYYVTGFLRTVEIVHKTSSNLKKIFYPSSVAVEDIPLNMGEYAAAKIAGETLCSFLEKTHPGVKIYKARLPRAATDQTVSLLPVDNNDPVKLMVEQLRTMRDAY